MNKLYRCIAGSITLLPMSRRPEPPPPARMAKAALETTRRHAQRDIAAARLAASATAFGAQLVISMSSACKVSAAFRRSCRSQHLGPRRHRYRQAGYPDAQRPKCASDGCALRLPFAPLAAEPVNRTVNPTFTPPRCVTFAPRRFSQRSKDSGRTWCMAAPSFHTDRATPRHAKDHEKTSHPVSPAAGTGRTRPDVPVPPSVTAHQSGPSVHFAIPLARSHLGHRIDPVRFP